MTEQDGRGARRQQISHAEGFLKMGQTGGKIGRRVSKAKGRERDGRLAS